MKVLILYVSYGNGHKSAAKAIETYLKTNDENVEVEVMDSYKYLNRFIHKITVRAYDFFSYRTPKIWKFIYYKSEKGLLSYLSGKMNQILSYKMNRYFKEYQPDVIISTHMFNNSMCGYLKKKELLSCKVITVITDYVLHNEWLVNAEYLDMICASNATMKKDLIKRGFDENKIKITGIPVNPIFNEEKDKKQLCEQFELNDLPTILFFASSLYSYKQMLQVYKTLLTLKGYQIIVLCGKNEQNFNEFNAILKNTKVESVIRIMPYTDKVADLMKVSDFIVTKPGGLTTSEALVVNVPIIICYPIPGQEDQNSNYLLNHGAAIRLFDNEDMEITLKSLIENKARIQQLKDRIHVIRKPDATKDIAELIY